jgi:hypothetical protein
MQQFWLCKVFRQRACWGITSQHLTRPSPLLQLVSLITDVAGEAIIANPAFLTSHLRLVPQKRDSFRPPDLP